MVDAGRGAMVGGAMVSADGGAIIGAGGGAAVGADAEVMVGAGGGRAIGAGGGSMVSSASGGAMVSAGQYLDWASSSNWKWHQLTISYSSSLRPRQVRESLLMLDC